MSQETKAFAERIATALNEPNVEGIEKIVDVAGTEVTAELFKKAAQLYKKKVMTQDGTRRRTAGGCFFLLANAICLNFWHNVPHLLTPDGDRWGLMRSF